jgi:hypothetical protein
VRLFGGGAGAEAALSPVRLTRRKRGSIRAPVRRACSAATDFVRPARPKTERHFVYGFEERVRNENWNNIFDYNDSTDDERRQVRYRTRLWMAASLTSNIDISLGVVSESNQILQPHTAVHFDEGVFETAYVDIKRLFVKGLSLRVGRQNLMKGEGFPLLEGDPWDGSRSIYQNAAVLGYQRGKSKVELIGIFNPRIDRFLPCFNDKSKQLVDWNEPALGAYYTDSHLKAASIEAYLFYKREFGDPRPATNAQFQADRYTYTAGGRAVHKLPLSFSLTVEFAGQRGHQRPNREIRAWGGYSYLKRTYGPRQRNSTSFGYWAMSGSDPATPGVTGNWNPLFARWPKWSEGYIYTQFREAGVAYWTNNGMWQAESVHAPWKPLSLRGTLFHMHAFHPFPGNPQLFSNGAGRGLE